MRSELLTSYLRYLEHEQNYSPMTLLAYGDDLDAYYAHCTLFLGEPLLPSEADLDLVRRWLSSMMAEGHKASSVSRRLAAVKGFYKYLLKLGQISKNPIAHLRPPKGEKPLPVYVPTSEIERILSDIPQDAVYAHQLQYLVIATLYECGLRRSELAMLKDKDVDTRERRLRVLGKGSKERIVPFGRALSERLEAFRTIRNEEFGDSELFFLTLRGKKMTGADVYRIVHEVLCSVPNLSRRGAHALRHSFATDMLNNGADLIAIKELMGHSQVATTVRYTHTSFKQLQQMYHAHPRAKK